jgi:hypothetical protein
MESMNAWVRSPPEVVMWEDSGIVELRMAKCEVGREA